MYAYASGSPATYGCETNGRLAGIGGGPNVYMRGPGFGCPAVMQRSGMFGLGVEPAPAPAPATGGSWADVFAASVAGLTSFFAISTQTKLAKQAQHSADRTAALNAQTQQTQQTFFPQVTGQQAPPAAGGGFGTTALVVGGVAVVGVAAWLLLRRRRR